MRLVTRGFGTESRVLARGLGGVVARALREILRLLSCPHPTLTFTSTCVRADLALTSECHRTLTVCSQVHLEEN